MLTPQLFRTIILGPDTLSGQLRVDLTRQLLTHIQICMYKCTHMHTDTQHTYRYHTHVAHRHHAHLTTHIYICTMQKQSAAMMHVQMHMHMCACGYKPTHEYSHLLHIWLCYIHVHVAYHKGQQTLSNEGWVGIGEDCSMSNCTNI